MTRQQCVKLAQALGADGFVTLSTSGPAPNGLEHTGSRSFLTYGSWLDLRALSLPLMESGGSPFGLQLLGLPDQDGKLCAHAHRIMADLRNRQNYRALRNCVTSPGPHPYAPPSLTPDPSRGERGGKLGGWRVR